MALKDIGLKIVQLATAYPTTARFVTGILAVLALVIVLAIAIWLVSTFPMFLLTAAFLWIVGYALYSVGSFIWELIDQ